MRYHTLGAVPPKRHTQFRTNGRLLVEEVMGYEGFSGNESILYHVESPCRIAAAGEFTPIEHDEWVPDAHVHRHLASGDVDAGGDPVDGRRCLMWNADLEVSICRPTGETEAFYRDGEGDELFFVCEGSGTLETVFGTLPFREHDYVVIPRGTTYRIRLDDGPQTWLVMHTPGELETPNRYRNRYGQLLESAPYSQRDFHPPVALETHRDRGEYELVVRVRGGLQRYELDYHPLDVVGWDGFLYPYTFNISDFEPITGRVHQPPPIHQTFEGPNFVVCSFCPRKLDYHPQAIPVPYNHSNIDSDEMIYYVSGNFGSRKGIETSSITLHPRGIAHGPHPGTVEKSLGAERTEELAVMVDTFRPLKFGVAAEAIDDPQYPFSWLE